MKLSAELEKLIEEKSGKYAIEYWSDDVPMQEVISIHEHGMRAGFLLGVEKAKVALLSEHVRRSIREKPRSVESVLEALASEQADDGAGDGKS